MAGPESISSIQLLFEQPRVHKAEVLELCICDAVHFRLVKPRPVFELVEERLSKRNASLFSGFADLRSEVERTQRVSPIKDKVDSCCIRNSDWVAHRQVIYSTELEVWMDIAYPNPWALEVYHAALKKGKEVHVPKQGPFTDLFHRMLLQKCGFERLVSSADNKECLRIYIGEQVSLPADSLHLAPPRLVSAGSHAFAGDDALSSQLINGVLVRDREIQSAKSADPETEPYHALGYQLVGPTLLLLIQSLQTCSVSIAFTGKGSGFLTTLCEELKYPWPWLPDISSQETAAVRYSLFPEKSAETSLVPARSNDHPSVLQLGQLAPVHLLYPAFGLFLEAFLSGSKAAVIQAAAAAFLKDYARTTRGLFIPVKGEPILQEWHKTLLSPSGDFVRAFTLPGILPGFRRSGIFSRTLRAIKEGRWPTGSYLDSSGITQLCLGICAPERTKGIKENILAHTMDR